MLYKTFKTSLPVAFGYIPLGMAFGVLLQSKGYDWWYAGLMGLFIYAGSGQFLAVGLLSAGAGLAEAFTATLFLNLRHFFYGITILDRYRALGNARWYAVFGLTDETFSLLAGLGIQKKDKDFVIGVTLFNHLWWILGCVAGGILGASWHFNTSGLEFSLTALFVVLLLEQMLREFHPLSLLVAFGAAVFALFLPSQYFLLGAIALSCLYLVFQKKPDNNFSSTQGVEE